MRLEINTGYSCYLTAACRCRGRFFPPLDLVPGAAVGNMRIEIKTGNSCYLIYNNARQNMAITELNSYSSFSAILVFVYLCLCLSHVFVIAFVFSIFTMTSITFSQSFLWHPHIPTRSTSFSVNWIKSGVIVVVWGWGGGGGSICLLYQRHKVTRQQQASAVN